LEEPPAIADDQHDEEPLDQDFLQWHQFTGLKTSRMRTRWGKHRLKRRAVVCIKGGVRLSTSKRWRNPRPAPLPSNVNPVWREDLVVWFRLPRDRKSVNVPANGTAIQ